MKNLFKTLVFLLVLSCSVFAEISLYDPITPKHYANQNIMRTPLFYFVDDPTYFFKTRSIYIGDTGINIYGSSVDEGRTIVYMKVDQNMTKSDIIVRDLSLPEFRQIYPIVKDGWWPVMSPDNEWIYFSKQVDNEDGYKQFEIFRIKPNGTKLERLTFTEGIHEEYPSFSRDGKRIAVVERLKDKNNQPIVSALSIRDSNMNEIQKIFACADIITPRYAFTKDGVNYWLFSGTFLSTEEQIECWGQPTSDIWIVSENMEYIRQLSAGVHASYPVFINYDNTIAYMVESIVGTREQKIRGNLIYINGYDGLPMTPPQRMIDTLFSIRTPWVDYEQKWIYYSCDLY